MRVDTDSLSLVRELAHDGAEHAADALFELTGVETRVETTSVTLLSRESAYERFSRTMTGVELDFEGALSGRTTLAFDPQQAHTLVAERSPEKSEPVIESGVEELGSIMLSGAIDGWADSLGAAIDMTPPTQFDNGVLVPSDTEHVFVFESRLEGVENGVSFEICMIPKWEPLAAVLDQRSADEAVPLKKLAAFNDMTREGASQAAAYISEMTGIRTTVEINRCSFVSIEQVPTRVGVSERVGVVIEYCGRPSGYLAILFDEPSARTVADALVPVESGETWNEMDKSAIKELGNIMTSGFVDGWANVLETSIEHSPPEFVHDVGSAIVSPIAAQLGTQQEHAFIIDSTVRTDDGAVSCSLYALPNERELMTALDELLIERTSRTGADPESVF